MNTKPESLPAINTLVQVNEHLIVTLLQHEADVVLCQNIRTGEFVVWHTTSEGSYCNGYYTHNLDAAHTMYKSRVLRAKLGL